MEKIFQDKEKVKKFLTIAGIAAIVGILIALISCNASKKKETEQTVAETTQEETTEETTQAERETISYTESAVPSALDNAEEAFTEEDDIVYLETSNEMKEYVASHEGTFVTHSRDKEFEDKVIAQIEGTDGTYVLPSVEMKNELKYKEYGDDTAVIITPETYDKVVVYIHGGDYVYGIDEEELTTLDNLSQAMTARIYIPNYKLLPVGNNATAQSLIHTIYSDAVAEGMPVIIMGMTSGCSMATAFVESILCEDIIQPVKLVLYSPWLDLSISNPNITKLEEGDIVETQYGVSRIGRMWAGDGDIMNNIISPMYGSIVGLPDTLIFTSKGDMLYPDAVELFNRLKTENYNKVKLVIAGEEVPSTYTKLYYTPEGAKVTEITQDFCQQALEN